MPISWKVNLGSEDNRAINNDVKKTNYMNIPIKSLPRMPYSKWSLKHPQAANKCAS